MTIQQIIGENLAKLREWQGLTRGDIAEGVNVTNQTVAALESGRRSPSADLLMKICNLLDVTPNDLLLKEVKISDTQIKSKHVVRVLKNDSCHTAVGRCPNCGTEVYYSENIKKRNRFCHCCGQKLRW